MAPGPQEDRVAAPRDALKRTFADPEFPQEATRTGMLVVHNSEVNVTRHVEQIIDAPPEVIDELRQVLGPR
jgi:hypothetical protein